MNEDDLDVLLGQSTLAVALGGVRTAERIATRNAWSRGAAESFPLPSRAFVPSPMSL
jgi:hypothetical protein